MKIREIFGALEQFAPLSLQESYDHAGLQIGLTEDADATGALLCLDVTEEIIEEAVERGCNVVVSHHPLLFRPLTAVRSDDYVSRTLAAAIRADVCVYSAHTNLDNARGGVCHTMADRLGLQDCRPLVPMADGAGSGLVGTLPEPLGYSEFLDLVSGRFFVDSLRHNDWAGSQVSRVALCGGAGSSLIGEAARSGADAFVTGEIGYHHFFGWDDRMLLCEIGHYESEQFAIPLLKQILREAFPELPLIETVIDTNPIRYR